MEAKGIFIFLLCLGISQCAPTTDEPIIQRQNNSFTPHIITDKPIYLPNDISLFNIIFTHSLTKEIPTCEILTTGGREVKFRVQDAGGMDIYQTTSSQCLNSAFFIAYKIPPDVAEGTYTAIIDAGDDFPKAERAFRIQQSHHENMIVKVDLDKDLYFEGEEVFVKVHAYRIDGKSSTGTPIKYSARMGGEKKEGQSALDEEGYGYFSLQIPMGTIENGGLLITISPPSLPPTTQFTSIPISIPQIQIDFIPETGYLVDNIPNRVYFNAYGDNKQSVDFEGRLYMEDIENKTQEIKGEIGTGHRGKGVFEYTPRQGQQFFIEVDLQGGKRQRVDIPQESIYNIHNNHNEKHQILFRTDNGSLMEYGIPFHITLNSTSTDTKELELLVYMKENIISKKVFEAPPGVTNLQLDVNEIYLHNPVGGVLILHLKDHISPNATHNNTQSTDKFRYYYSRDPVNYNSIHGERLIFAKPRKNLEVILSSNSNGVFGCGGKVELNLKLRDRETGESFPHGFVNLRVTDAQPWAKAGRKTVIPRFSSIVMLENEVLKDNSENQIYFPDEYVQYIFQSSELNKDINIQNQEENIDLLLGIQNWRRFVYMDRDKLEGLMQGDKGDMLEKHIKSLSGVPHYYGERMYKSMAHMAWRGGAKNAVRDDEMHFDFDLMDEDNAAGGGGFYETDSMVFDESGVDSIDESPTSSPSSTSEDDLLLQISKGYMILENDQHVYSHLRRPNFDPSQRVDFTETLYFGTLQTDKSGEAHLTFETSDKITEFKVIADAFSSTGFHGMGDQYIRTQKIFGVDFKLPHHLVRGDQLDLPINILNYLDMDIQAEVKVNSIGTAKVKIGGDVKIMQATHNIPHNSYHQIFMPIKIISEGTVAIQVIGRVFSPSLPLVDKVVKISQAHLEGFPITYSKGGLISQTDSGNMEVQFPKSMLLGNYVKIDATLFPSPLGSLTSALSSLIVEPYGCFEQTASTTYPLVMVLEYLRTHRKGELENKMIIDATQKLRRGYEKLLSFEAKSGGYEWFGGTPGNEALTSYGLLLFNEMKNYLNVDEKMVERVVEWMLSRRDGKGSFLLDTKSIDSFGRASKEVTHAYMIWVLSTLNITDIVPEVEYLVEISSRIEDCYIKALLANSLLNLGGRWSEQGKEMSKYLAEKQGREGEVSGSSHSITRSGGESLLLETTSLSIIAWMKDRENFIPNIEQGMKYIESKMKKGKFGSTQSTILCLKAIIIYDLHNADNKINGKAEFGVFLNSDKIGDITLTSEERESIKIPIVEGHLVSSIIPNVKYVISLQELSYEGTSKFSIPYLLEVNYMDSSPPNRADLNLTFSLSQDTQGTQRVGQLAEYNLRISNHLEVDIGMVVGIIRMGGCYELSLKHIEQLKEQGKIEYFEVVEGDLYLYWRGFGAGEVKKLNLFYITQFLGVFRGRASKVYEYYNLANTMWLTPAKVMLKE